MRPRGQDGANELGGLKTLKMMKALLLNGPATKALVAPAAAALAEEAHLAAALANHRLFQQRQALLWPQRTVLDDHDMHLSAR